MFGFLSTVIYAKPNCRKMKNTLLSLSVVTTFCLLEEIFQKMYTFRNTLHPEEDLFLIHKIQEGPFHQHQANGHHYSVVGVANQLAKPAKEPVGRILPVYKSAGHIYKYRVHTDNFKKERPAFMAQHINDVIKKRQQQQAVTANIQHKRTGP
jgi:hypothetical protein